MKAFLVMAGITAIFSQIHAQDPRQHQRMDIINIPFLDDVTNCEPQTNTADIQIEAISQSHTEQSDILIAASQSDKPIMANARSNC